MGIMTCPSCGQDADLALRIGTLGICSACGASVNIAGDGSVRRATAQDTAVLTPSEHAQLTKVRASIARAERRQR